MTEVGPTMGIGAMDGGMDVELPIFKMEIRIAESIDLINDMDMESIVGRMTGCMMENLWTRSGMGKGRFSFQMVHVMKVNSTRGNVKGLGPTLLRMEDITLETWSRGVMKDLEVRYVYVVTSFDFLSC